MSKAKQYETNLREWRERAEKAERELAELRRGKRDTMRDIAISLADGGEVLTATRLARAASGSAHSAYNVLSQLCTEGRIVRIAHGRYRGAA